MRIIHRKLLRDVARLRGQLVAITLVTACGMAMLITMRNNYNSLLVSRDVYYERYRFGSVFAHARRAPRALIPRIAAIPGVAAVEARVVTDASLEVPGLNEPAVGRLVSLPERGEPVLNGVYVRQGRMLHEGARDEVLASEAFAAANGLRPGDTLTAIINGHRRKLAIAGIALSPEYIYAVRGGWIFPDDRRFGVLWMRDTELAPLLDMRGAFNDVSLSLAPGASPRGIIAALDEQLAPYGGSGAYDRSEHPSDRFIEGELRQNRTAAVLYPVIALSVVAFLLHVVLSRLVALQRDQLAVLKAFGYSSRSVAAHYLELALFAIAPGALVGILLGVWLGYALARYYVRFFHFPELHYEVHAAVILAAVLVSGGAAILGALGAVRRVLTLPPAEAMRPDAPARFRPGLAERIGLARLLSPVARMAIRNFERRPITSAMAVLGVALASVIIITGLGIVDSIRYTAAVQFQQVQREDATVVFNDPEPPSAVFALARVPGVIRAEPYRTVLARLRVGYHERRIAIEGLDSAGELRRIVDRRQQVLPIPASGLVLSAELGRILHVGRGGTVTVEILEGTRPIRQVTVVALVDDMLGLSAYMDLRALHVLLGEGATASGAFLMVDPPARKAVYARLKQLPAVATVGIREAAVASFDATLAQSLYITLAALLAFALAIAAGVVYNSARIALSERARDLATLRVLGFTQRETATVLLGEQALLVALSLPLGWVLGWGFTMYMLHSFATEVYRMPTIITVGSYTGATLAVLAAAVISAGIVRRRIAHLDLVSTLKARE